MLLGSKWEAAGDIFTFFGPGIGIMLIYLTSGVIHLSIGRADRWFRWVVVEFSVTVLLFLLGLHWGPAGVAAAWTASFWLLTIPAFWYAGKPINFGVAPVLATIWRYVLASLLAGCATALAERGIEVSKIWHGPPFPVEARQPGPDPERASYGSFCSFADPDGNLWLVQEVTTRRPGRVE